VVPPRSTLSPNGTITPPPEDTKMAGALGLRHFCVFGYGPAGPASPSAPETSKVVATTVATTFDVLQQLVT